MTAEQYIDHLQLLPHPEGGFYRETYRSEIKISNECLPQEFGGDRTTSTAIYYLLKSGDYSAFHKIKSDECWHFYAGGRLLSHMIDVNGRYDLMPLGNNIGKGETLQFVVPANTWFASEPAPETAFSLVGCTVAPGFDFRDFEMADKDQFLNEHFKHEDLIKRLCRQS